MAGKIQNLLSETGRFVIDGSMSSALEEMGCDLNDSLWTAKVLLESPEMIKEVHKYYFRAGADCGITCTYQATVDGFMRKGLSRKAAEDTIRNAVRLFLEARDEWWNEEEHQDRAYPLCLGSVGPYGACLADGSEYRGNYGISRDELKDFHETQIRLVHEGGADVILCETVPSLEEALIQSEICEEKGLEYWISFSCQDGHRTCEGQEIGDCAEALRDWPHLQMIGVNCTMPQYVESLIREMAEKGDRPVAAYPNNGSVYDPVTKTWRAPEAWQGFYSYALSYYRAGAAAVGGCCTTLAPEVSAARRARDYFLAVRPKQASMFDLPSPVKVWK